MAKKYIVQINTINISELYILAKSNGHHSNADIAKWIISVSPYWKSKGYNEILTALKDNDIV